ncbi:hypothetical protein BH10PAT4_BH10PAT4_0600 [soil metagenome]
MLLYVAVAIAILWLLGFTLNIGGGFVHLLIVIALVVFIIDMVSRRRK